MLNQSKLILTAVDNNDTFWYDLLLPFLITLKKPIIMGILALFLMAYRKKKLRC